MVDYQGVVDIDIRRIWGADPTFEIGLPLRTVDNAVWHWANSINNVLVLVATLTYIYNYYYYIIIIIYI